jgi:outer membrane protein OmpA-like peptidoglycan-associated protein
VSRAIAVLLVAASLGACSTARRAPAPPAPAAPPPEPAAVPDEKPPSEVDAARAAEEGVERVDVAGLATAASESAEDALVVAEVPFAPNDAALDEPARRTLAALIDELRQRQEPYRLELETDGETPLAEQRAQAVKAYLEESSEIAASSIRILPAPAPRAGRTDRVLVVLRRP